ncbi:MAG: hypothetical protein HY692_07535 [Cyanobacteria bacterium NC_groundwater_1444_Ag_S-0.65um_54_12]|nr:hypothetical protein [Cyanobacteria bacterium NC_groundwater_1444_Ag_S-0.65um_54_12]
MPPRDELDEHFHRHPRLKKYAELFDAQEQRHLGVQQRFALLVLLLLVGMLWFAMANRTGSWLPWEWGLFGQR